jgi:hypothetical protein
MTTPKQALVSLDAAHDVQLRTIDGALGAYGSRMRHGGGRKWRIRFPGRRGTARLDNQWLEFTVPARRRNRRPDTHLLEKNNSLAGNAKHILIDGGNIQLRADVPLHSTHRSASDQLANSIRTAMAGLADAAGVARYMAPTVCDRSTAERPESGVDLGSLFADLDWRTSAPAPRELTAELKVTNGKFYQATVVHDESKREATVDLLSTGDLENAVSRLALGVLLLSTGTVVRLARPVARVRGNAHGLGFAVELSPSPTAEELDHALSALSVACDTCGRELEALKEDPDLARDFLAMRHPQIAIPK